MTTATERLAGQFKALAEPVRLRLWKLCAEGECSVSELTDIFGLSQPRVSQHLRQLADADLVERFRDGHFVYYRVPLRGAAGAARRRFLQLLPADEPQFAADLERLLKLRESAMSPATEEERPLHRALLALTVTAPLGDLLDIGAGHGRLLKLLASRARRAVGVDIDADARRFARAELLLAGLPNCTLRQGDMYALPFAENSFDTIIVDDVLADAKAPVRILEEAARLLRPGGRLLLLSATTAGDADELALKLAGWCRAAGQRMTPVQRVPAKDPRWLLSVATPADTRTEAA